MTVPKARRNGIPRWLKRTAITLAVLAGLGLVGVAALQIRLSMGPIGIPRLVGPIERGLSGELGETKIRIGAALLYRSERSGRIEFRLKDLRAVNHDGETVVRVPSAAIDISRNALVQGIIAPRSIELIRPRLILSYDPDAGLSLQLAGFNNGPPAVNDIADATLPEGAGQGVATNDPALLAAPDDSGAVVSFVQLLQDTFKAARERQASTSYLKHVGIRDAVIVLRTETQQTVWSASQLGLELRHQSSRSVIRGNGTLTNGTSPWGFAFEIDDTPARGAFQVRTLFKDVLPGEFGRVVPFLADLNDLAMPLSGQLDFHLARDGALVHAGADIKIGAGQLVNGLSADDPGVRLDEGHVKLGYSSQGRQIKIEEFDLLSAEGRLVMAGVVTRPPAGSDGSDWNFDLSGKVRSTPVAVGEDTVLSDIALSGSADSSEGAIRVDRLNISWPEGQIAGRAHISRTGGVTLSGQIGEMTKTGLLQGWPPFLARDARRWITKDVSMELITGGQFSISVPSDIRERLRTGGDIPAEAVSLDVDAVGVKVVYVDGMPPVELAKVSTSIRGRSLRMKASTGVITLASGKSIALKQSDLVILDLRPDKPEAQIFTKVAGGATAVIEFLKHRELDYLKSGIIPGSLTGDATGTLRFQFPMHKDVEKSQIRLNGSITLANGAAKKVLGDLDMAGGSIVFDLTEKAVEASGDVLFNGVPAKLRWLRLIGGSDDKQPPLRISARLDAADRTELGLHINHAVDGTIDVNVAISPRTQATPLITVQADLTRASVGLDFLSWQKAVGKSVIVEFDVVGRTAGGSELQNFKVIGDDIAIDGWIRLGSDYRVQEFAFPDFTLNVITRMEVSGFLNKNNIWEVKVRAASLDARPMLRNLFAPRRFSEHASPKNMRRSGLIIRTFVKRMIGFSNTILKEVQLVLQKRKGKIVNLEVGGAFENGVPLTVSLKNDASGRRVIYAETRDAGLAFRLTGVYKNVRRGESKFTVNLDEPGVPDISGVLWTRNFYMLGDPVVSEVLRSGGKHNESGPVLGLRTQRDTGGQKRTVIEFDQLRFNFSIGNGQFLLRKSFINGPALGATLRGKVDFVRRRISLGGTYVPLYGLNSALGSLPLLGPIFVGELGEGVLGITFAIQGNLDKPNVLVNPVSLVAPGIFRKIFELSPSQQRITPRKTSKKRRRNGAPKSSSAPAYSIPSGKKDSPWPDSSRN